MRADLRQNLDKIRRRVPWPKKLHTKGWHWRFVDINYVLSRATVLARATVGSNLRIGYEASLAQPGDGSRLSPRRTSESWAAFAVSAPALFDKLIEERETQAAESWRILGQSREWLVDRKKTLAISAFQAITMARLVRGNPGKKR
jgi:hypothetical protein